MVIAATIGLGAFARVQVDNPNRWAYDNKRIAHALGGIDRYSYTNTLDAFHRNYAKGYRVFEIDLILTSDGHLVGRHDWGSSKPPSLDEFKSKKYKDRFTPLSFDDVVDLMCEHQDIYIVTDTKETDAALVKKQFESLVSSVEKRDERLLDRVIPQIYNEEMLDSIRSVHRFQSFIYTLYQTKENNRRVIDFSVANGIKVVTMSASKYTKEFVDDLRSHGIFTYVHTINTLDETKKFPNVHGFYSDWLDPK